MANVFRKAVVIIFVIMLAFVPLYAHAKKPEVVKLKFETFLKFPGSEEKVLDLASLPENFLVLSRKQYPFSPESSGVLIFDEKRDEWRSYDYLKGNKESGKLIGIYKNGDDIWLSAQNASFYYSKTTKKFTKFPFAFYSIAFDGDVVWLGTTNKLLKFDKKLWALKTVDEIKDKTLDWPKSRSYIDSISHDKDYVYYSGYIYVKMGDYGAVTYLKKVHKSTEKVDMLIYDAENQWNDVYDCAASEKFIWCLGGTDNSVLQIEKGSGRVIERFNGKNENIAQILQHEPREYFLQLFESDNVPFLKRMVFSVFHSDLIKKLFSSGKNFFDMKNDFVCEHSDCWVGSRIATFKVNMSTGDSKRYIINGVYPLSKTTISQPERIDDDYVIFKEIGLTMYNRKTKQWKTYSEKDGLNQPMWSDAVVRATDGDIWRADENTLCRFNKKLESWKCYENKTVSSGIIRYSDKYGHLWPSDVEAGLKMPDTSSVHNGTWDMQIGTNQIIWLSDRDGALYFFDIKNETWENVGKFGARSIVIHGDTIWLGSKTGIVRYDRTKKKIEEFVYDWKEKITRGCSWILKDGDWMWCSPWIESIHNPYGIGLKKFNVNTHKWLVYNDILKKYSGGMLYQPTINNGVAYFTAVYGAKAVLLEYDGKRDAFHALENCNSGNPPRVTKTNFYCGECNERDYECKNIMKKNKSHFYKRVNKKTKKVQYVEIPENQGMFFYGESVFIQQGDYLMKARLE